jgi:hypothetical protein
VKKASPSQKRKTRARSARSSKVVRPRQSDGLSDPKCSLCNEAMRGEPEWQGDIDAALGLPDLSPQKSRHVHHSCGELLPELVAHAIRKMNRRSPGLRLRMYPWLSRCAPFRVPLPNLRVCREYFDNYKSAEVQVDSLHLISKLLLELRREHPVEWECCGWKNDAISNVVLGYTHNGYPEDGEAVARSWFTRYWGDERETDQKLTADLSEDRSNAADAVLDMDLLQANGSFAHCARFVRWLRNDNWEKLAGRKTGSTLYNLAVHDFLSTRPRVRLSPAFLVEIAAAYEAVAKTAVQVTPYRVVLELLARRHHVSARLVARVRSQLRANAPL